MTTKTTVREKRPVGDLPASVVVCAPLAAPEEKACVWRVREEGGRGGGGKGVRVEGEGGGGESMSNGTTLMDRQVEALQICLINPASQVVWTITCCLHHGKYVLPSSSNSIG